MDRKEMVLNGRTALGIELGSTRIKAVLIGEDHSPIASGDYEWENQYENNIWTYSLDMVWKGLQESYRRLAEDVEKQYGVALETVGSIGFSAMMHGYIGLAEGKLTTASNVPKTGSILPRCGYAICGKARVRSALAFTLAARRIPLLRQSSPTWRSQIVSGWLTMGRPLTKNSGIRSTADSFEFAVIFWRTDCGYHEDTGPEGPPGRGHQLRPQRGQDPGARPHRPPELRPWPGMPPDAGHETGLRQGGRGDVLPHHPVLQAGGGHAGAGPGDRHRVCKRASAGV